MSPTLKLSLPQTSVTHSLGFCSSSQATPLCILHFDFVLGLSSLSSVIALTLSLGFNHGIFEDVPKPLSLGQLLP